MKIKGNTLLSYFMAQESSERHITKFHSNQKLVCEENNKRFELDTKDGVFYRIKLDGGISKRGSEGKKVDFLVVDDNSSLEAYIELKGTNVRDALEQIKSTLGQYRPKSKSTKCYAYIISSNNRIPKTSSSYYNNLEKLSRELGRKPIIKSNQIKVFYSSKEQEFIQTN